MQAAVKRRLTWAMTALLVAGAALASTSLVTHYRTEKSEFCDLSESFNCDMVNRGPYATFATSAPLVFPDDPSQPPEPWLERVGDGFTAHVVQPLNEAALHAGIKVPVAGIGLAGYLLLLALTWIRGRGVAIAHFVLAVLALTFSLYLTYVEKYIIAYWCILCLSSLGVIFVVTILSGVRVFRREPARQSTPAAA